MSHLSVDIRVPIEDDNIAIKRIESLCIKCGKCRDVCKNETSVLGRYDLNKVDASICVHCGQCINVCPTGALQEKKAIVDVMQATMKENKKVVFLTSPAVRVALGEEFGLLPGSFVEKQMVGALFELGSDYVFDTTFAADLTIMEEASELIERIQTQKGLPQFTSCCPAWVRFCETYYPELLPNVSTSKSPISMFGASVKTYFAKTENIDPKDIVCVALTPCTAKKAEIKRPEMIDASIYHGEEGYFDVDHVITTRELAEWMKASNLDIEHVPEREYDSLMKRGSGAGLIFGNTGGVMEAAVRSAYYFLTKETPPKELFTLNAVRGLDDVREASLNINGLDIKIAVIHTLDAVRKFIATKNIEDYQFIEVMCCKGGCIGGGGQPKVVGGINDETRKQRIAGLYSMDEKDVIRTSHENAEIKKIYESFYGKPLSELAESLLHTSYVDRSSELNEDPTLFHYQEVKEIEKKEPTGVQYKCSICGYIYDGEDFESEPDDYVCPLCKVPKDLFEKIEVETPQLEVQKQWVCSICGYVYDGDNFENEPDDYVCPICKVPKDLFELK